MAVYALGFPAAADVLSGSEAHSGDAITITDGLISAIRTTQMIDFGPEVKLLQISAAINSGNSGGPLLNGSGEVIGINTLGITNAEGIYGAIDVSELLPLLEQNGITPAVPAEPQPEPVNITPYIIAGAVVLLIAAAVVVFVLLRKNGRVDHLHSARRTLSEYIKTNGMLDVSTAVSLLMPVALQLRDKHQQGEVFLKLSPDNLLVTPKGCIISPKASGAGFLNERFAAPEQLEGRYTGIKSDIYSFMAVLSYAISDEALAAAPNLALIIAKGMSTDPEQRYASMQDVIFTLSPFNTGEVNLAREHSDRQMARTEKPVKPKLKIKYGLLIPACVLVLLGAFAGYVLINHNNAVMAMGELDFATAGASFDNTLLGGQLWPKEQAYINAGLLMESGDFDGAVTAFEALGDYSDAPTMILEAQYRKATTLMNGGDFDNAKILYESLGEYKDSKAQVLEVQYRQAAFLTADNQFNEAKAIYDSLGDYKDSKGLAISALINKLQYEIEKEDYVNALATIRTLDDSMYEDIDELIKPLLPKLYEIGIDLYNNDNYHIAYKYFDFLNGKNYEKSDTYMVLATLHLLNGGFVSVPDSTLNQYYNNLLSYLGFEDVNAVIISNRKMALNFLNGSWRNGSYYFSCISDKFQVRYNLPEIHGRYYELINGIFYTNNYRIWEGGLSPYTGVKRMSQSFDPRL